MPVAAYPRPQVCRLPDVKQRLLRIPKKIHPGLLWQATKKRASQPLRQRIFNLKKPQLPAPPWKFLPHAAVSGSLAQAWKIPTGFEWAKIYKHISMTTTLPAFSRFALLALLVGHVAGPLLAVGPLPQDAAATQTTKTGQAQGKGKKKGKGGASKATKALGPVRWEETIQKFEAADAAMPPPKGGVLLVGGSNAKRWADIADYFPQHQVLNRGFGGAQLTEVLHFTDRIVLPYAPKTIILNAGGNDLGSGKTPEQVRDAARAFITKVHATLPETRIYCLGLPPVLRSIGKPEVLSGIRHMNSLYAEMASAEKNVEFIDLLPAFLDEKGQPRTDFFVADGTHFSPKGYAAVTSLLKGKF